MKQCKKCHSKNVESATAQYKERLRSGKEHIAINAGTLCLDCGYFKELGGGWFYGWWVTKKELEEYQNAKEI